MGTLLLVILEAMAAGIPLGWLFLVATLAGLGYPLLFSGRRESAGPAVIRGTAYGFLCWIVAELTLPPQLGDRALGWSRQAWLDGRRLTSLSGRAG